MHLGNSFSDLKLFLVLVQTIVWQMFALRREWYKVCFIYNAFFLTESLQISKYIILKMRKLLVILHKKFNFAAPKRLNDFCI